MAPVEGLAAARVLGGITAVPLSAPPRRPTLPLMTGATVRSFGRLAIRLLVALPLALLLLVFVVGTAAGASTGRLVDPAVSPNPATAGTAISFGVTYADTSGLAPVSVVVRIDEASVPMTGVGSDYSHGVRFSATAKPAVGWHTIYFIAIDAGTNTIQLRASNLHITSGSGSSPSPSPTPTPTPAPTPTRLPSPTPTPAPTPTLTPTPTPSPTPTPTATPNATLRVTPAPTLRPSQTPVSSPHPTTTPGAASSSLAPLVGTGAATHSGGRESTPAPVPSAVPSADGSPAPGAIAGVTSLAAGSGAATDPMAEIRSGESFTGEIAGHQTQGAYQSAFPFGLPAGPYGPYNPTLNQLLTELAPTIAMASAGGAAWAAFAFFGRRRRDDAELDETVLSMAAASVYEAQAAPGLRVVDESLLPRWRRPSLQEVRRTDPLRAVAAETPHLSFENAGVRPLADFERRRIGYRLVRLLDSPDEFRSTEIGILDQGDEVQLLERRGVYWLVLCPDGRQGWVHRMTLADAVAPDIEPVEPEPMPEYMDDEPAPAAEIDETDATGLLEAYLKARGEVA
jgi:hypothetical protein